MYAEKVHTTVVYSIASSVILIEVQVGGVRVCLCLCVCVLVLVCVYVCVCVCVCVCLSSVCMVGVICVYVDMVDMGFMGILFMLSWVFQHDYLDTYCFECLISYMHVFCIFVFAPVQRN